MRAIDLGAAAADRPQDALDVAASPLERGSQPATGDQRTRCALGSRIELSCVHACTLRVSKRKKKINWTKTCFRRYFVRVIESI